MAARYLKSEVAVLKAMYATETEEDIMDKLPNRNWVAVCRYARTYLNLHRSRKAIGIAVTKGHIKAKRESEEEKIKNKD